MNDTVHVFYTNSVNALALDQYPPCSVTRYLMVETHYITQHNSVPRNVSERSGLVWVVGGSEFAPQDSFCSKIGSWRSRI